MAEIRDRKFRNRSAAKKRQIIVPHVTIRQSISILLLKLIVLEIIAAIVFVIFHPILFSSQFTNVFPYIDLYNTSTFFLAVLVKMIITIYAVLAWLNEYFEITPSLVRHKKGIFFVKVEQLALDDIQSITLQQGLLGKLLNFGTLSLFDWKWRKLEYLYDIHNPTKYLDIIETLLPGIDEEKDIFISEHLFKERKDKEGGENNG